MHVYYFSTSARALSLLRMEYQILHVCMHVYASHKCKRIFRFELEAVIDKILNFHEISPNFTFSQKS